MSHAGSFASMILAPLAAATLAFIFPRLGRWLAFGTAGAVSIAFARLTRLLLDGGVQVHRVGGWGAPLGIDLRADGLAVFMLLITTAIGAAVMLYALRYFNARRSPAEGHQERYFWPLFLLLWSALNALLLSTDIFNLYVTLELLGFSAVLLIALDGRRAALTAALRYLFVSLSASLLYLLGVAIVYTRCATVDLTLLATRAQPGFPLTIAIALMTGGLLVKSALIPGHFWLPPAHANAPAPVSALLSALVVKGSFYIMLRLWFEAFPGLITPAAGNLLGGLGAAAVIWGALNALFQKRLKLLVAYSTVAQLGYLFLLFPLAAGHEGRFTAWSGGLVFLASHACAKAAMFLSAGNVVRARGGRDEIAHLEGMSSLQPISTFAFGLAGLSLIGLPPSGGFAGKWLLLRAGLAAGQGWWVAVILIGSLLAAAYVARVLVHGFTRAPVPGPARPNSPLMEWTALALAILAAGMGFLSVWLTDLLQVGAPAILIPPAGGAP